MKDEEGKKIFGGREKMKRAENKDERWRGGGCMVGERSGEGGEVEWARGGGGRG